MHTGRVSTVRAGGPPRTGGPAGSAAAVPPPDPRPAGVAAAPDDAGTPVASGAERADLPAPGRLDHWPAVVRVPAQVLGRTVSKAWRDRILGLSGEAAFWQILSVPPLLIALLGSLGYLGDWIGAASVQTIEDTLVDAW